jgi:hypothetical protein
VVCGPADLVLGARPAAAAARVLLSGVRGRTVVAWAGRAAGSAAALYALAPPELVPSREMIAGASPAVRAAVFTLLVSATTALIAWRRGWFRHQPKGIIS